VKEITFLPPAKQEKKISLNLKQIVTPPSTPKPMPKPVVTPPMVKPVVQKPIEKPIIKPKVEAVPEVEEVKRVLLDKSKKNFATKSTNDNNVTKVVKKPVKKVVKKEVKKKPKKKIATKRVVKKKVVKKKVHKKKRIVKRKARRSKDPLANMIMGSGSSLQPSRRSSNAGSYGERMIKRLYGKTFNTFTPSQKKFIRHNLNIIQQITQRTLSRNGYPTVAIQTQQEGINIVSFYLHPNGDISGLRLKKRIGYTALDNNTLKVIKIAYKNYPLPNQTTKITFYVQYSMY